MLRMWLSRRLKASFFTRNDKLLPQSFYLSMGYLQLTLQTQYFWLEIDVTYVRGLLCDRFRQRLIPGLPLLCLLVLFS